MKKKLALVLAAMMLLGAVKGMADDGDAIDYEIQMGKINAAQASAIQFMIEDMENYKAEADALYAQDGISRVGDITKLTNEAQILESNLRIDSNGDELDAVYNEVLHLKIQACSIVRGAENCSGLR